MQRENFGVSGVASIFVPRYFFSQFHRIQEHRCRLSREIPLTPWLRLHSVGLAGGLDKRYLVNIMGITGLPGRALAVLCIIRINIFLIFITYYVFPHRGSRTAQKGVDFRLRLI